MRKLLTKIKQSHVLVVVSTVLFVAMLAFQNCSPGFQIQSDLLASQQAASATPEIDLSSIADLTNAVDVTLGFSVTGVPRDAIAKVECQLGEAEVRTCAANSITYSGLADGDYLFKVSVETKAGLRATASRVFRKDATKPVVTISSTPSELTNQVNTSFVFTATDALSGVAKIQCATDAETTFKDCTSPASLVGLAPGAHSFKIQVTDKAGNKADLYSYSWTIDTSVPTVTITTAPQPSVNSTNASFAFSGVGLVSYQCEIDGGGYTACTSPRNYTALAEGNHTFRVRGTNGAGTVSSPAQYTWMIDATPPTAPVITTTVTGLTTSMNASFSFSSTDARSGVKDYQCSLDGAAFATCVSPRAYTGLSGSHVFRVQATDNVGNVSPITSFNWTIDANGPTITLTSRPNSPHISETSSFAFAVNDSAGVESVKCRWTGGILGVRENALVDCASLSVSYDLGPGIYVFEIEAFDRAGNKSNFSYRWEVEDGVGTPMALRSVAGHQDGLCAFNSANQVVCSGYYSQIPKVVAGFAGAKQISAYYEACVVTATNTVRCGLPGLDFLIPLTDVPGLSNVASVAAGTSAHCAVLMDGTARCWGQNTDGQLGNGTKTDTETTPVVVSGLTGVTSISASYNTMCAIVGGGAVRCWGDGSAGQLGQGANTSSSVPVSVIGVTGAKQVVAGRTSCALMNDGTVKCWGDNSRGMLGNGTFVSSSTPVLVSGSARFSAIAGDGSRFCGLLADGSLSCWGELSGSGYYAQPVNVPTDVGGFRDLASLSTGRNICASHANGTTRCMFYNWNGGLSSNSTTFSGRPARSPYLRGIASVVSDGMSSCALGSDKTVSCWGFNDYGQLGDGTTKQSNLPVRVSGLTGIKKIVEGSSYVCAQTATDTVKCWGYNVSGALGTGNQTNSLVPVDVSGLTGVKTISAGGGTSCALMADETVKCWGYRVDPVNFASKNVLTPMTIAGLSGIKAISSGSVDAYTSCGVKSTGRVACWSLQENVAAIEIANVTDAKEVSVGQGVACALTSTNGVKCWGSNEAGSLGGDIGTSVSGAYGTTAVNVVGLESGVAKIAAHNEGACALKQNGEVYCWGQNYASIFGNGTTGQSATPVLVSTVGVSSPVVDIHPARRTLYLVHADGRVSSFGQKYISYGGLTTVIKSY